MLDSGLFADQGASRHIERETIAEKLQTFYTTLGDVEAEVLVNKVAARMAVKIVRTLCDKLTEV